MLRNNKSQFASVQAKIDTALDKVSSQTKDCCYQAWLGFYNSQRRLKWSKPELVSWANEWAKVMRCSQQPALFKKTVGKMGLRGTPGLNVK